jgi:hypothetical protein
MVTIESIGKNFKMGQQFNKSLIYNDFNLNNFRDQK